MANYEWYQNLIKPSWAPPAWLFGRVWTKKDSGAVERNRSSKFKIQNSRY